MISTHPKRPLTKALGQIVEYCRRKITRSARYRRQSDAEVKAGMAAAGVDLDTLDEFLNDKVPTEFDLDPSELRENDSDIDGICY